MTHSIEGPVSKTRSIAGVPLSEESEAQGRTPSHDIPSVGLVMGARSTATSYISGSMVIFVQ
ncbi:hypothetical protein E4U19_004753 [Claviceps sp. Clav32 group G5]|nr:hypothetical protein E4U19_004753 [Claviceps sp. Clav32 group G5]